MSEYGETAEHGPDPFDEVKRRVNLLDYFIELGAEPRESGDSFVCRSPWRDERTPSLHIHPDTGFWKDFGGDDEDAGTIIDAVMRQESFEQPLEAVKYLNDKYKLGLVLGDWKHAAKAAEAKRIIDAAKAEMDDPRSKAAQRARDYLTGRGYTQETWETFELSVDKDRGRIVIPIHEKGGHAIGFSGRSLYDDWTCKTCGEKTKAADAFNARNDTHEANKAAGYEGSLWDDHDAIKAAMRCQHCGAEGAIPKFLANQFPKYKDSGGNWGPKYSKDTNLYNLHRARRLLRKQKETDKQPFLLVEGFADVWASHQSGFVGCVAFNGNKISTEQARLLVKAARDLGRWIGIILDNDPTGRIQASRNIRVLREIDRDIDIRILHGIDSLAYTTPKGDEKQCKDAGDVLQHHGESALAKLLRTNWWSADEYRIRQVLEGDWDRTQQMDLVRSIVKEARHTLILDDLVPLLTKRWEMADENVVRKYMHDAAQSGTTLADSKSLLADVDDMHRAAETFLADEDIITCDYEELNALYPGNGFRRKMLHMVMGRSGTGKTTLVVNMLYQFIRRHQVPCVFFSLEMPQEQLFMQFVQIALKVNGDEVERMVKENDPRLEEVKQELRKYLVVVDNVPDETGEMQPMTPDRVLSMIHDINLIRGGDPVRVIAIDHLGIMEPGSAAGKQAQESSAMGWGYVVKRLFTITKQLGVTLYLLQQMNAAGAANGEVPTTSSSRGSSEVIDFMDSIIGIHRPSLKHGLTTDEQIALRFDYILTLLKNRYGPMGSVKLHYEPKIRTVMEPPENAMPAAFMPEVVSADLSEGASDPAAMLPVASSAAPAAGFGFSEDVGATSVAEAPAVETAESQPPDWFFG